MIDSAYIIISALLIATLSALLKTPGLPGVFFVLSFLLVLLALALYDECYLHLPNHLLVCLLLLSCIIVMYEDKPLLEALLFAALSFVTLLSVSFIAQLISREAKIGMGDIKLLSILAISLKEDLLILLILSCILFVCVNLLLHRSSSAFGPYIVICWFIIYLGI